MSSVIITGRGPVTIVRKEQQDRAGLNGENAPGGSGWDVVTFELHQFLGHVTDLRTRDGTARVFNGAGGPPMASERNDTGRAVFLSRSHPGPGGEIGTYADFEEAVGAVAGAYRGWTGETAPCRGARGARRPDAEQPFRGTRPNKSTDIR